MWTHLDAFSGIGGFALAAEWTGRISPVQFVEIDPFCRRVLAKHWPGVPQHDDIRTFVADASGESAGEPHDAPNAIAGERQARSLSGIGGIDLLTGGFPCQPFSAAGKRGGADDDRYLWPELARVIRSVRPRFCLLENVGGIVRMEDGLDRVLADLGEAGYSTGAAVIPAAAVGAYHRRDRVWIVAHAEGAGPSRGERDGRAEPRWPLRDEPANAYAPLDDAQSLGRGLRHAQHERPAARDEHAPRDAGAVRHAAARGVRRGQAPGQGGLAAQPSEDAADASPDGLRAERQPINVRAELAAVERGSGERSPGIEIEVVGGLGQSPHGLPRRVDGRFAYRPFGPDWEDGIPRVTAHEAGRVNKLKALGNAIVPQVAYELMLMMLAADDEAVTL